MRFNLNLATKTYIDHRLVNSIIITVLVILSLLLLWNVTGLSTNMGESNRLQTDISALEGRLNSRPAGVSEQDFGRMQTSIKFYNGIIERKSRNWLGLLGNLERATPEGIAITSFNPDTKTGEIKLEGVTKSFSQIRSYLEKLEDCGHFKGIQLESHQDTTAGKTAKGIQFCITLREITQ